MKKPIINSIKISLTMLGSIVGAGFATGREIVEFFGIYGKFAPQIIIITGVLFFIAMKTFFEAGKHEENKFIKYVFDILIFIAEFILLSTMLSALFVANNIFLSSNILTYILIAICFIVSLLGIKGLSITNIFLSPILILSVIAVCIISVLKNPSDNMITIYSSVAQKLSYPVLYFGLNLFTSYPLCKTLGKEMTKREIKLTSIITSTVITITIGLIAYVIIHSEEIIANSDMPLAILACNISPEFGFAFFFVILAGIITTLLSSEYILNEYHKRFKINKFSFALITIFSAYLFNFIGFSKIVTIFYPMVGIFGAILFITTFFNNEKEQKIFCSPYKFNKKFKKIQ